MTDPIYIFSTFFDLFGQYAYLIPTTALVYDFTHVIDYNDENGNDETLIYS